MSASPATAKNRAPARSDYAMGALAVVNPSQRRTEWLTVRTADRGREFVLNRTSLQVRVPTILMGSELMGLQFLLEHLACARQRRLRDIARLARLGEIPDSGKARKYLTWWISMLARGVARMARAGGAVDSADGRFYWGRSRWDLRRGQSRQDGVRVAHGRRRCRTAAHVRVSRRGED